MIKYGDYISINSTANNTKRMYACYNGTWTMKDATVIGVTTPAGGPGGPGQPQGSNQPLECGDPGAPQGMEAWQSSHAAVVVEKADVGNPKNDMRFMVFVVNGSWDNTSSLLSYDKMEDIYYTPEPWASASRLLQRADKMRHRIHDDRRRQIHALRRLHQARTMRPSMAH